MKKAEKWTKFVDLWVRVGLSHLVRASQNLMCTHCPAELQRHTGPVIVCTLHDIQPPQPHRQTGPTFMKSPLVCLCVWMHVCECGRRVSVKNTSEKVIFSCTLLQTHCTIVKLYTVRCVVPSGVNVHKIYPLETTVQPSCCGNCQ